MMRLLIVLFSVITTVLSQDQPQCIWYKVCYTDDYDKAHNCPYSGPGFPLEDEEGQQIMLNRCPDIFTNCKRIGTLHSEQFLFDFFLLKNYYF